jgi:protein-S-isoprenylcysteine O-methyltransferase Ste14
LAIWQSSNTLFQLEIGANLLVSLCTILTIMAVVNNFIHGKTSESVNHKKKSIVETGSMTMFFILSYLLVRYKIGVVTITDDYLRLACLLIGSSLNILGCFVNIIGRRHLGGNWGNQILIYKDHTLVTDGAYKWVRHPLYASLIWMFYGSSLVYGNAAVFIANTLIFLPFMQYRGKQEEEMLSREFPDYKTYRQKTGMLFPLFFKKK